MLDNLRNRALSDKIKRLKKKNNGDVEVYKVVKHMIKTGNYDPNLFNYIRMHIHSGNINNFLQIQDKRCLRDIFADYIIYLELDSVLLKSIYFNNRNAIEVLMTDFNCPIEDKHILYVVKYSSYECFDLVFHVNSPYNDTAIQLVLDNRDVKMFDMFVKNGYSINSGFVEFIKQNELTSFWSKLEKYGCI